MPSSALVPTCRRICLPEVADSVGLLAAATYVAQLKTQVRRRSLGVGFDEVERAH